MSALLEPADVRDDVDRVGQRDDRVADQLAGAVPGDLPAAVDVDHRGAVDRPLVRLGALAGGVDRRVLQQQQGVRPLAGAPAARAARAAAPRPPRTGRRLPGSPAVHSPAQRRPAGAPAGSGVRPSSPRPAGGGAARPGRRGRRWPWRPGSTGCRGGRRRRTGRRRGRPGGAAAAAARAAGWAPGTVTLVRWARSAVATPCARAISSRTSASRVGASVELATSARPSGL